MQPEFRTSKLCSACHVEMRGAKLRDQGTGRIDENFHVRNCRNRQCARTFWDRDVNAAINIGYLHLYQHVNGQVPQPFQR